MKAELTQCTKCGNRTLHDILFSKDEKGSTEYVDWYHVEHQVAQCRGCENICFRKTVMHSEDTDDSGQPVETIDVYPTPKKASLEVQIPYAYDDEHPHRIKVKSLYKETLKAWHQDSTILAAAGMRPTWKLSAWTKVQPGLI